MPGFVTVFAASISGHCSMARWAGSTVATRSSIRFCRESVRPWPPSNAGMSRAHNRHHLPKTSRHSQDTDTHLVTSSRFSSAENHSVSANPGCSRVSVCCCLTQLAPIYFFPEPAFESSSVSGLGAIFSGDCFSITTLPLKRAPSCNTRRAQ